MDNDTQLDPTAPEPGADLSPLEEAAVLDETRPPPAHGGQVVLPTPDASVDLDPAVAGYRDEPDDDLSDEEREAGAARDPAGARDTTTSEEALGGDPAELGLEAMAEHPDGVDHEVPSPEAVDLALNEPLHEASTVGTVNTSLDGATQEEIEQRLAESKQQSI